MTFLKILKAGVLLAISSFPALLSAAETDATLKSRLVGTWYSTFEWKSADDPEFWVKSRGQDTYSVDGQVHGISVSLRGSQEERVEYSGRWGVNDGFLVVEVTDTSGGYIEAGMITRDRIMQLDASTMTLEAADGNTVVLHRDAADAAE